MASGFKSLDGADTAPATGAAYVLDDPKRVGPSPSELSLQVDGMMTNDIVQVEGSNDEGDTWTQIGDDITADDVYAIPGTMGRYRANLSDDSGGGTVDAIFFGGGV